MYATRASSSVNGDVTQHCTRQTITHALYDLAVNPEWLKPIREEIEPIIAAEGWTKSAIGKMNKVDSILKEVLRFHGTGVGTSASVEFKSPLLNSLILIPRLLSKTQYLCHASLLKK